MVHKIAVTVDERSLTELDRWVREGRYPNRSKAVQSALTLLAERDRRSRLARELDKLNPREERQLAEEALGDAPWPEY
jgi:Arc/MetJ-type ribon-helix-helix transcriptional regulator